MSRRTVRTTTEFFSESTLDMPLVLCRELDVQMPSTPSDVEQIPECE